MIKTDYVLDNKELSYELFEDGYKIYLDGMDFIHQYEPFIPNPKLTYEENAIAQIEDLIAMQENAEKEEQEKADVQQQITDLELALVEVYEMLGGAE